LDLWKCHFNSLLGTKLIADCCIKLMVLHKFILWFRFLSHLIVGDINRLNLKFILNLSPDLQQVVKVVTRTNPEQTHDVIITNIQSLYHAPTTLAPLAHVRGKSSDHLIVVMEPLSSQFPTQEKRYKVIKYRPFTDSAIREMGLWVQSQSWNEIYLLECPNQEV
jgi:hypothetical protein